MIVAGHELELASFGNGLGSPPIVLLHEGLGSLSHWRDFPEALAARTERRVVAYSRYGHGQSDVLDGPRNVDYMHHEAEVVLPALLAALGIERPVLFGHSDGASIALLFAARYPDACAALVLEAPHVFVEAQTVASIARMRDVARETDLLGKMAPHHRDPARTFWGWNNIWLDPAFRNWDITDRLPRIIAPVFVLQGKDDEYGSAAQVDAIAARVPQVEAAFIDRCGHSPHRSAPAVVLDATSRFLSSPTVLQTRARR